MTITDTILSNPSRTINIRGSVVIFTFEATSGIVKTKELLDP